MDIDDIFFGNKEAKRCEIMNTEDKKVNDKNKSIGLDIGTGWICGAYHKTKTKIGYAPLRSCFYDIPESMFGSMFNMNTMKYVKHNGKIYIIGEDALTMAKIQGTSALRPLRKGVINPKERDSAVVLKEMLEYCIRAGNPENGAHVVFSVPAQPIDNSEGFDTEYHSMSISALLENIGYKPTALNEAYAVLVSELQDVGDITGLGFSYGAGLVNVAFVYKGMLLFAFSINKSGDFIDQEAARATGTSESMINHIKENQLDLKSDLMTVSPEERALILTHSHVIKHSIKTMIDTFNNNNNINIIDSIPIVISGGSTLPNGFLELFQNELNKTSLPFEYSEIIPAKDPLKSVSKGCLLYADMLSKRG